MIRTGHDEKYRQRYKVQLLSCGVEKDHGKIERRSYHICTDLEWLEGRDEWANLNAVGMVEPQANKGRRIGRDKIFPDIPGGCETCRKSDALTLEHGEQSSQGSGHGFR